MRHVFFSVNVTGVTNEQSRLRSRISCVSKITYRGSIPLGFCYKIKGEGEDRKS